MTSNTRNALIMFTVVGLGIAAAAFYLVSHTEKRQVARPGGVYDPRRDPELIRVVQTALSLEAVMTRLTSSDPKRGFPKVKYALEEVSQLSRNMVRVRYRLIIAFPNKKEIKVQVKRFVRRADGSWAPVAKKK